MLTVSDTLLAISRVYNQNKVEFINAQQEPPLIKFLTCKVILETRGKGDPKVIQNIIKTLVESNVVNTRTIDWVEILSTPINIKETSCNNPHCECNGLIPDDTYT